MRASELATVSSKISSIFFPFSPFSAFGSAGAEESAEKKVVLASFSFPFPRLRSDRVVNVGIFFLRFRLFSFFFSSFLLRLAFAD